MYIQSKRSRPLIALSGGFDPLHVGHVRMIKDAFRFGDLVIFVNSDQWLERKKGAAFMPYEERKEILEAMIREGDLVRHGRDDDGTVVESLKDWMPDMFGNGGDRTSENTPEQDFCEASGIHLLWGLGGGKVQSSSELVGNFKGR